MSNRYAAALCGVCLLEVVLICLKVFGTICLDWMLIFVPVYVCFCGCVAGAVVLAVKLTRGRTGGSDEQTDIL